MVKVFFSVIPKMWFIFDFIKLRTHSLKDSTRRPKENDHRVDRCQWKHHMTGTTATETTWVSKTRVIRLKDRERHYITQDTQKSHSYPVAEGERSKPPGMLPKGLYQWAQLQIKRQSQRSTDQIFWTLNCASLSQSYLRETRSLPCVTWPRCVQSTISSQKIQV